MTTVAAVPPCNPRRKHIKKHSLSYSPHLLIGLMFDALPIDHSWRL